MVADALAAQGNAAASHSQEREFSQLEQWCLGRGWDPAKPDDAETWLGKGLDKPKKIDADYQREKRKAEQLEHKVSTLTKSIERLEGQLTEAQADRFKQQHESLERKFEQAVEDGDVSKAREIQDQLFNLKSKLQGKVDSEKKKTDETHKAESENLQVTDPIFLKFVDENPWYEDDPELRSAADSLANELKQEFPYLFGTRLLTRVKERIVKEFPDKFGDPESDGENAKNEFSPQKRPTAPDILRGNPSGYLGPSGKKMAYKDLPEADKVHCDRFVKQQLVEKGMKRDEAVKKFLAIYESE